MSVKGRGRWAWCGLAVAVALAATGCERSHAAEADTLPLAGAIGRLTVEPEPPREGYDREAFDLYQDADGDGCDARREVLIAEATDAPEVSRDGRCWLTGGTWFSYLDGKTLHDERDVQIDHTVALAEAWDSGASKWSHAKLVAYGSDLTDPEQLIGVSGPSNSRKSDTDPGEWMPKGKAAQCRYAAAVTGIKLRWGLSVDDKERAALVKTAKKCTEATVRVWPAPNVGG